MTKSLGTALAVLIALQFGCATVGQNIDEAQTKAIEKNKTTKAQIEQWFGPPTQKSIPTDQPGMPAGFKLEQYTYVYSSSLAGLVNTVKTLVVIFDDTGVVYAHAYAEK